MSGTSAAFDDPSALEAIADGLLSRAAAAGVEAADVVVATGESLSITARSGALEEAEREETIDFGLRVLVAGSDGLRQACVSASDPKPETLDALTARVVAMAHEAPALPEGGLAPVEDVATTIPDLDLCDRAEPPGPEALLDAALGLEAAAVAVPKVSQVESAGAGWRRGRVVLFGSNGVRFGYESGSHSVSVAAVAGADAAMERDYAFGARRHLADLPSVEEIGREAGERAARRLNPRKAKTGAYPVVFEPRVAAGLVGSLLGALNGAAIARGSSFLKARMGERILPADLSLIDDPTLVRGLGSRPVDGDGLPVRRKALIADGVVANWLLDVVSARKLGATSNGSANRSVGGAPAPGASNAWLTAGSMGPDALISEIEQGLYVTEMMGAGLNIVTGDYSRGAAGFWIENGEIAYPVSELTVAGHIDEMLAGLTAADDLVFDRRVVAPTLRIEGMTIAAN